MIMPPIHPSSKLFVLCQFVTCKEKTWFVQVVTVCGERVVSIYSEANLIDPVELIHVANTYVYLTKTKERGRK